MLGAGMAAGRAAPGTRRLGDGLAAGILYGKVQRHRYQRLQRKPI
jgi:hypothetical protein